MIFSRRKASSANYLFGLTQVFFVTLNGIILVPRYLSEMSVSLYGAWLAGSSVLTVLSVVDLGIATVLTQQLAGLLARDALNEYANTAFTGLVAILAPGLVIALLGIASAFIVPSWFHVSGLEALQLTQAIILASIAAGLGTIAQTWGALPQAAQRTVGMGLTGTISMIVWLVATLSALAANLGVVALGLGLLVRAIFLTCGYLLLVIGQWRSMRVPRPQFSISILRSMVRLSAPVFLSRVGGAAGQNAEPAITALVVSTTAAAILNISSRMAVVVRMAVGPIGTAVFASLSHVHATGSISRTRDVLKSLFFISNLLLAIGLGATMAFNRDVVSLWVGIYMYGGDGLTLLIVLSTAATVAMSLNMNFLQSMGHFRDTSYLDIAEIPLRLALMVTLGAKMGIIGLVLAGLIATLALKSWAYPRLLARSLRMSGRDAAMVITAGAPYFGVGVGLGVAWLRAARPALDWPALGFQMAIYTVLLSGVIIATSTVARGMIRSLLLSGVMEVRRTFTR